MYNNITILNPKAHGFYRFTPPTDLYFAKALNLVPITFSEVKLLCCDYPVVIVEQEGLPKLMLLTGLETNTAIDEKGKWSGSYTPAFLRRYPFTLVKSEEESETLHIGFDLESGLFSSPDGEELFAEDGGPSEALKRIKDLLSAFQKESQLNDNILLHLKEKELLKPSAFQFKDAEGKEKKVGGFFIVDKEKLLAQEDTALLETIKNGWMELVELQQLSLGKTDKLQI